ncbi:MAG: (2Fe-2S)-binding protein [Actinomycetota bacterium]|nr:(2Fe-2S)-binding protein [Actinomycetota bacterium]
MCHCRGVSGRRLHKAIDHGCTTLAQVCRESGAGNDCGTCVPTIKEMLEKTLSSVAAQAQQEGVPNNATAQPTHS